jgi:HSP20 family molecular chaperone IbpA
LVVLADVAGVLITDLQITLTTTTLSISSRKIQHLEKAKPYLYLAEAMKS